MSCIRMSRDTQLALGRWWDWADPQSRGEFWPLSGATGSGLLAIQYEHPSLNRAVRSYVIYAAREARLYPAHLSSMGKGACLR